MKAILISLVLITGFAAHAEELAANHPCKNIKAACEAAGFQKGQHKSGKGLWKDCMQKLKAGESVPGVTVAAGEIEACKANLQKHGKGAGGVK